jgi:hypothetical protein
LAPASAKPLAIMKPIPREPPVIKTFFSATENREEAMMIDDNDFKIWIEIEENLHQAKSKKFKY